MYIYMHYSKKENNEHNLERGSGWRERWKDCRNHPCTTQHPRTLLTSVCRHILQLHSCIRPLVFYFRVAFVTPAVQVDLAAEELHNNVQAQVAVVADINSFVSQLLDQWQPSWKHPRNSPWWKVIGNTLTFIWYAPHWHFQSNMTD